jgi:phosphoglycolate phosphatase-like HAD superfamily hydrolase
MDAMIEPRQPRYRHIFMDAEGTLYVPKHGRSRWEFWANPSPEAAVDFFELDDGVIATLEILRESAYSICIVSRNTAPILDALLEKFGILHYFDEVILSTNKGKSIESYLSDHGLNPEEALMVGDMPTLDLYPVRAVGIDVILVDRQYNRVARSERIKGIKDLPAWLKAVEIADRIEEGRVKMSTLDDFFAPLRTSTRSLIGVPGA